MHFICRSFIGHSPDDSWCQFWENEPDDPLLVEKRGHLFGLISFSSSDADVSQLGHQLIATIDEKYYQDNEFPPNEWLKTILDDLKTSDDFHLSDLSLIIVAVVNQNVHLAIVNSGSCFLVRRSQISPLLQGQSDSVSQISGHLLAEDRLFICTDNFYHQFTLDKIKLFLALPSLTELEESFLGLLYSFETQSHLAGVFIGICNDQSEEISLPPLPSPVSASFSTALQKSPTYISRSPSAQVSLRRRFNIAISLIILIALGVSSYFGYRQNQHLQTEKKYQELKTSLTEKITTAFTVKNLNIDDALNLAKESEKILSQMSALSLHQDEINQFQSQLKTLLSQTGSTDSFTPDLFFDTSLIGSNFYSRLALSNDNLYLLDSVNGRLDQFDVIKKSHQNIITSDDLKNSQFIAENNNIVYVLKDDKIFSTQDKKVETKITLLDQIPDFSRGEFHFWNGSLYVLSLGTSESSIWKYSPSGTGFGSGQKWLKSNNNLPVDSSSFSINGDIWVISKTGVLVPYSLGSKKDYKSVGVSSLTNVANLIVSSDDHLLAYTNNDNQVYTYNKTNQSLGRYSFDTRRILSLAYSQASNTIFVLCEDQKIYKITL